MTPQQAQKLFNEEFQKRLHAETFPVEFLPYDFDTYKHAACQHESVDSIMRLGFSWIAYKALLMKQRVYTLFEIGNLVAIIQTKTVAQLTPALKLKALQYYEMQDEIMQVAKKWNELVDPIREAVDKKVEIMSNAGGQMNTRSIRKMNGQ